jgi:hypothetical protein
MKLADLPAQGFQVRVPRPLGFLLPLHRRIEAGIAPDVADRRRLVDVDMRQQACRDHRADSIVCFQPEADRLGVGVTIERALDLLFQRAAPVGQPGDQQMRLGFHRLHLVMRALAIVLHQVIGVDQVARLVLGERGGGLHQIAR